MNLRKKWIRFLCAVLIMASMAAGLGPAASAANASGEVGGLEWSFSGGVLTISGTGEMPDYEDNQIRPWDDYADRITSVVVESGVENVGDYAFCCLENLTSVSVAGSVELIGRYAFFGCPALETVSLGNGIREIDRCAFEQCSALTDMRLPGSLEKLRYQSFYLCTSLPAVTVPSSVVFMEESVFAYCENLRTASVLANIPELPLWTFYGCTRLTDITLGASITSVGEDALERCVELETVNYAGPEESSQIIQEEVNRDTPSSPIVIPNQEPSESVEVHNTQTVHQEDKTIVTEEVITQSESSTIRVEKTTVQTEEETNVDVKVEAVVGAPEGWQEIEEQVNNSLTENSERVNVEVRLPGEPVISGNDLKKFAGKNVRLTIITRQNVRWYINGMDLLRKELAPEYCLSLNVEMLGEPNEAQKRTVGVCRAYTLQFDGEVDFNHEVEVPLSDGLARQNATFFTPVNKDYFRAQTVLINDRGAAHFLLGFVEKSTEYLIGINVGTKDENGRIVDDALITGDLKDKNSFVQDYEHVEYVVTGVKSSLGININQLTWILFGGMGACVIVVGVVVYILFKRKLAAGYVPDMSYADDPPQPKPVKKQKNAKK